MMYAFWQSIAETPWWLIAVFSYFFYVGLKLTKPRQLHARYIYFSSVNTVPLLALCTYLVMQTTIANLMYLAGGALIGIVIGFLQFRILRIKAVKDQSVLHFPGSWFLLIVLSIIFVAKYHYHYAIVNYARSLFITDNYPYFIAIAGFSCGMFIGRILYTKRLLINGPFVAPLNN